MTHSYEFVKEKIESLGGVLVSKRYHKNDQKLKIICGVGHKIKMCFKEIQRGHWCRKCADIKNSKRLALPYSFVKDQVEKCGGELISKEYFNDQTELKVICEAKHEFDTNYNNIRGGNWCPDCANLKRGKAQAYTYEFVKTTIEQKGGILLSNEYIGCKENLSMRCSAGHEFDKTFDGIMAGYWCRKCATIRNAKKAAHTFEFVKKFVEKRGGTLISEIYENANTPLKIICEKGHIFDSDYARIGVNNSWCSFCPISKTQTKLKDILDDILCVNIFTNYKKFDWLRNPKTNTKMEIDLWIPDLKLAIEYNGEQHFMPVTFGGITKEEAKKNLKQTKYLDRLKNKLVARHQDDVLKFIRFTYKEPINQKHVLNKLIKYDVLKEK